MGFSKSISGLPLICVGQSVVARNKQRAISTIIRTFTSSQGQPIHAHWVGDEVQVQTDKNRAFLVINNATLKEL